MEDHEESYEERVKRRVLILKDYLEKGLVKIPKDSRIEESLKKARFDSNGEPDIDTIDATVRSMALAIEQLKYRQDFKDAISLLEIQNRYFETVDQNFKGLYQKMMEEKITPHQMANTIAYGERSLKPFLSVLDDFIEGIYEFWQIHIEPAYFHIEDDQESIKAVFGGDFFPSNTQNIASKCGIYTDTIILPCPFIRSRELFPMWDDQMKVYYLLKHVLNVLQYKSLALADTDKPIVVVVPEKELLEDSEFNRIKDFGSVDGLIHASKIFGIQFESIEELFDFAKEYDTVEKIVPFIKNPNRVLFDIELKGNLHTQIQKQIEMMGTHGVGTSNAGLLIASMGMGRMGVCNELLYKSARLNGTPLIDAPTSWEYFKWKLEYDTERANNGIDFTNLHVVKGINRLSETPLQWIGKIPPEGLIELRKSGAINEIREILAQGIKDLAEENANDFVSTSHKVFNNINRAFKDHESRINELKSKKWKFAGKDIGSWLVVGTIELAAACTGTPFWGASAVILDQTTDAPKLKDLPKSIKKLNEMEGEINQLKKSPLGMIFKYKTD